MSTTLTIAVSGLNAAMNRVSAVARNIANASSAGHLPPDENGAASSYQPVRAVSTPVTGGGQGLGVTSTLQPVVPAYDVAFDPSSPYANEQGLVAAPHVEIAAEITEARMATAAYRANVAVIKATDDMEEKLFDALL